MGLIILKNMDKLNKRILLIIPMIILLIIILYYFIKQILLLLIFISIILFFIYIGISIFETMDNYYNKFFNKNTPEFQSNIIPEPEQSFSEHGIHYALNIQFTPHPISFISFTTFSVK